MSVQNTETPFPVIDADPHFNRVLRYFRPSDYAAFAGLTVAAPAGFLAWQKLNPVGGSGRNVRTQLGIMTVLGAFGGFLYAYQQSSLRFMGWKENAAEVEKDFKELSQRAKEGKPLYGESMLPQYIQDSLARYSKNAALVFDSIPFFNFVNHQNHGVDTSKYYEGASKAE
ncbi:hypothetical protein VTP01DRAFT_109 [Rhizomucor pusillus]|uniref:uncharacterized protein n=1 Tax=Rhizomucor pusillus TaxID=4840 RepID=UPI003743225E